MIDNQLRLSAIVGEIAPDDYQAFWNGLPIGRILKQPGGGTHKLAFRGVFSGQASAGRSSWELQRP